MCTIDTLRKANNKLYLLPNKGESKRTSINGPYLFIQNIKREKDGWYVDLGGIQELKDEIKLLAENVGEGFLVIKKIVTDNPWIQPINEDRKIALEWKDEPLPIMLKVDTANLNEGEHKAKIRIETNSQINDFREIGVKVKVLRKLTHLLKITPAILDFGQMSFCKEETFLYPASSNVQAVSLIIDSFNDGKPILMQREGDNFKVNIPLEDGEYFYKFTVDGEEKTDNKTEPTIHREGFWSKKLLNRFKKNVTITNITDKNLDIHLEIDKKSNWVRFYEENGQRLQEKRIVIGSYQSKDVAIQISPEEMGWKQVNKTCKVTLKIIGTTEDTDFEVIAKPITQGPIPEFEKMEIIKSPVIKGVLTEAEIRMKNIGQGELKLLDIYDENKNDLVKKIEEPKIKGRNYTIKFFIDTDKLDEIEKCKIKIIIKTNGYIWSKDELKKDLEFDMLFLKAIPEKIDFGEVFLGETKEEVLKFEYSDKSTLNLQDIEPINLPPFIKVQPTLKDKFKVILSLKDIEKTGMINEEICFVNNLLGVKKIVPVIANVVEPRIDIEIFQDTKPYILDKIILPMEEKIIRKMKVNKDERISDIPKWYIVADGKKNLFGSGDIIEDYEIDEKTTEIIIEILGKEKSIKVEVISSYQKKIDILLAEKTIDRKEINLLEQNLECSGKLNTLSYLLTETGKKFFDNHNYSEALEMFKKVESINKDRNLEFYIKALYNMIYLQAVMVEKNIERERNRKEIWNHKWEIEECKDKVKIEKEKDLIENTLKEIESILRKSGIEKKPGYWWGDIFRYLQERVRL